MKGGVAEVARRMEYLLRKCEDLRLISDLVKMQGVVTLVILGWRDAEGRCWDSRTSLYSPIGDPVSKQVFLRMVASI